MTYSASPRRLLARRRVQRPPEQARSSVEARYLGGTEPAGPEDPDAVKVRTEQPVADLVEPAKSETLDKLGEGRQALEIAAAWVRAKWRRRSRLKAFPRDNLT